MRISTTSASCIRPSATASTKLVRIEGANLDRIKRSNIKAAAKVDA